MNTTTRSEKEHFKRRGGIDPAALAAASLASAISTIAQSGPYTPVTLIIASTICLLIYAYDVEAFRSTSQSLAYSAVVGLIVSLGLGWPLECYFGKCLVEAANSSVPPLASVACWVLVSACAFACDGKARNRWTQIAT